jgi:hypothetical protein
MLLLDCQLDCRTKEVIKNYINKSFRRKFTVEEIKKKIQRSEIKSKCCLVEISDYNLRYIGDISQHDRFKHLDYFLSRFSKSNKNKEAFFIFVLNDGSPIDVPCFSIISRPEHKACNIPIPMGNDRGIITDCGTPLINWDHVIKEQIVKHRAKYVWEKKINKAVFRGQLSASSWKIGATGKTRANSWKDTTRGFLYEKFKDHVFFDIGFTKSYLEETPTVSFISMAEQQKFKYILNVGNNVDWAERLRISLFMNSLNIIHETKCQEWFHPLMIPYVHYIPTDQRFNDLEENIKWCINNDTKCQEIVKNSNLFAKKYLSEEYMYKVFEYTLNQYLKEF